LGAAIRIHRNIALTLQTSLPIPVRLAVADVIEQRHHLRVILSEKPVPTFRDDAG
jgi:hypothetical protein